jgi:NAD-dependent SIR2 family protein deacetylase
MNHSSPHYYNGLAVEQIGTSRGEVQQVILSIERSFMQINVMNACEDTIRNKHAWFGDKHPRKI